MNLAYHGLSIVPPNGWLLECEAKVNGFMTSINHYSSAPDLKCY